jgi:RHS repeat-associated protein
MKTSHYSFGMRKPNHTTSATNWLDEVGNVSSVGFNGKENDNDISGIGNFQDYGLRMYDTRLGRFISEDPLTSDYPYYTPYQFAGNTPTKFIDLDGGEPKDPGDYSGQGGEAPKYTTDPNTKKETASAEMFKWVWNNKVWGMANVAITQGELKSLFPNGKSSHLTNLETTINLYGASFGISNYNILAHFLGQAGHETGGFTKEATYEGGGHTLKNIVSLWGITSYAYKQAVENPSILKSQESTFNLIYCGKNIKWLGNGDEASGDGYGYRGAGYMQLTGKYNYGEFTKFYNSTFQTNHKTFTALDVATNNNLAIQGSLYYFKVHTVTLIKKNKSFLTITQSINSKAHGLENRKSIYLNALNKLTH